MMDRGAPARVVGLGAVTSIGLYPEAVAAAAAGGIVRVERCESMRDGRTGAPVRVAMVDRLPRRLGAVARMRWMGERALAQATEPMRRISGAPVLAAYVALPPERPGPAAAEVLDLARALLRECPVRPASGLCSAFATGHEGGTAALARALEVLRARKADLCLVGGVDSYFDTDTLDWLARMRRLSDGDNPRGMVPGEGAAFALLAREEIAERFGLVCFGSVLGAARALEPKPWFTGQATQARGLTEAIAAVLQQQPAHVTADVTYCDANGEAWRMDEWMYAYLRTSDRHGDPLCLRHPAEHWGEVGAASAGLLLSTALIDHRWGRTRGPRALLWCASDMSPMRGAALVESDAVEGRPWE